MKLIKEVPGVFFLFRGADFCEFDPLGSHRRSEETPAGPTGGGGHSL